MWELQAAALRALPAKGPGDELILRPGQDAAEQRDVRQVVLPNAAAEADAEGPAGEAFQDREQT